MRLFAALAPPADVLDELEAYTAPLRAEWPVLRWSSRDLLHVTLAFFGEVDEKVLERLQPRLERAASRTPPIELSFAGAGVFPFGGAHARVLFTGVYGDRRELAKLAASCSAAGRRSGAPLGDHKTYRPHLTLARCRTPLDVRPLADRLSSFAGRPWTATALHLIRSDFPTGGYETLRTYPLKT
jgi:2'-5' RNA ligase